MGMLFCYTVFGRRSKSPFQSSLKTGLKAGRRVSMERRDVTLKGTDAEANIRAEVAMLKVNKMQQDVGAECVVDCNALVDSVPHEHLGSEKGCKVTDSLGGDETVVDIHKLEDPQPEAESLHHDLTKSCYELRSSCSQGTFQGDVSLSVGEGTICSNLRAALPFQQEGAPTWGGSLGAHEYAASEESRGELSNRSLRCKGSHDGHSVRSGGDLRQFEYSGDDGAQATLDEPFTTLDALASEDRLQNTQVFSRVDAHAHNEDAYSGHASDPGVYEREVLKMSPSLQGDGSDSPLMGAHESNFFQFANMHQVGEGQAGDEEKASFMPPTSSEPHPSKQGVLHDDADPSFDRVREWINSLQQMDVDIGEENFTMSGRELSTLEPSYNVAPAAPLSVERTSVDHALGHAAVRALHPSSTVAHVSGIGLWEVPPLGMFISLKTLNLSANLITHVPVGCLPRSLHSLDLSRNRIAQIEGFRELARLRVLNLSYNRIPRIGHGLANCTLIKELYIAGNKIAEVEGLHRLLKLAVLDLSFNKLTTSKALGQLAANYGSLLALNLLGNPILTNFSEDQMRKLVTALTPHVAYLNRQPIKVVSVREAALDSVARAALGSTQRYGKSRDVKAARSSQLSSMKKKPPTHQHGSRHSDKKLVSATSSGYHRTHSHHGKASVKGQGIDYLSSAKPQVGLRDIALNSRLRQMPRSRSADVLAGVTFVPDV